MNHTSCQFRDKHTVGGIVFYKHAFLVTISIIDYMSTHMQNQELAYNSEIEKLQNKSLMKISKLTVFSCVNYYFFFRQ